MIRPQLNKPARGDALARRHIAQWRRITARLTVLINATDCTAPLADEAHALRRQCERLACTLGQVADEARQRRCAGRNSETKVTHDSN